MSLKQDANKEFPKWPIYDDEEIKALRNVIQSSKWWCGFPGSHDGENVWRFQKEFSK